MPLGAECLAVRISKHDMAIGTQYQPSTTSSRPTENFLILKKRKPIHRQILKFSETETRISIN
jgi:hypothetical protein